MRAPLAALALAWLPLAAARARVVRLDTALGPERVLVLRPAHPRATLVILPGGTCAATGMGRASPRLSPGWCGSCGGGEPRRGGAHRDPGSRS
ncbi:unnamed protein product [Acidocella sp. C78]|uniref:hypothetical protein n=1 Tax=Acidocella sp. C78 TaxID=1671486 RepID=UPI001BBBF529|nr:hypothetical protein [Acidocella sp. C78]CAG4929714.1 unnamed protein product [Acidocella sp. C78]